MKLDMKLKDLSKSRLYDICKEMNIPEIRYSFTKKKMIEIIEYQVRINENKNIIDVINYDYIDETCNESIPMDVDDSDYIQQSNGSNIYNIIVEANNAVFYNR
jgi:hypothetical protein